MRGDGGRCYTPLTPLIMQQGHGKREMWGDAGRWGEMLYAPHPPDHAAQKLVPHPSSEKLMEGHGKREMWGGAGRWGEMVYG